jgi:hypothetical protein
MQYPTLHLNGTSATDLLEQTLNATHAVSDAITKLEAAAPNARDYYPAGQDALLWASREYQSRIDRLVSVKNELMDIAEHICDKL